MIQWALSYLVFIFPGLDFPGGPVVRDSVIPMQGAWVRSLVGTKIPHVGWSKKEANYYIE